MSDGCRLTDIPAVFKFVSVDIPYVSSGSPLGSEGDTLRTCDRHQQGFRPQVSLGDQCGTRAISNMR